MYTVFKNLSKQARIWVYSSNRKFYPQEIEELKEKLKNFASDWKTDNEFLASYDILYNRFIVFATEENSEVSITDIDKQVALILQLQQEYKVELLDKMNVCFKQGQYIQYKDLKEFKKLLKNNTLSAKTIVFDNLIQTKEELEQFWEIPITESWYNRFL